MKIIGGGGPFNFTCAITDSLPAPDATAIVPESSASIAYQSSKDLYVFEASLSAGTKYYLYNFPNLPIIYNSELNTVDLHYENINLTTSSNNPRYFTPDSDGVHYIVYNIYYGYSESSVDISLSTELPDESAAYTLDTEIDIHNDKRIVLKFNASAHTAYYLYTNNQAEFDGRLYYSSFSSYKPLYSNTATVGLTSFEVDETSITVDSEVYVVLDTGDTDFNSTLTISTTDPRK